MHVYKSTKTLKGSRNKLSQLYLIRPPCRVCCAIQLYSLLDSDSPVLSFLAPRGAVASKWLLLPPMGSVADARVSLGKGDIHTITPKSATHTHTQWVYLSLCWLFGECRPEKLHVSKWGIGCSLCWSQPLPWPDPPLPSPPNALPMPSSCLPPPQPCSAGSLTWIQWRCDKLCAALRPSAGGAYAPGITNMCVRHTQHL